MDERECPHDEFHVDCKVGRLEETPGTVSDFLLEVRVRCTRCDTPFQFLGLPQGLNLDGASCDFDKTEARLAISPDGLPSFSKGVRGYRITKRGEQ